MTNSAAETIHHALRRHSVREYEAAFILHAICSYVIRKTANIAVERGLLCMPSISKMWVGCE